jgi:hypothetical protein
MNAPRSGCPINLTLEALRHTPASKEVLVSLKLPDGKVLNDVALTSEGHPDLPTHPSRRARTCAPASRTLCLQ